jgi:hypothetical protein
LSGLGIYKNDPGTAAVIPLRGIEMKNQSAKTSLVVDARVAGFLYLIIAICGIFSMMYVPSKILVPGNAAATAANILASESLFRIGIVSDAVVFLSEIALIAILYALLKPVNETLSLVAALFRLAMAVIQGVNLLFNLAALQILSGADYMKVFDTDRLQSMVLLFLNARTNMEFLSGGCLLPFISLCLATCFSSRDTFPGYSGFCWQSIH